MLNSPVDCKGIIKSKFVKDMEKQGFYEIARWNICVPDSIIINQIEKDEKLSIYAAFNRGVGLITHAGVKAFFAHIPNKPQSEPLNQVYNNRVQVEKRLRGQKDSDQSSQEDPSD